MYSAGLLVFLNSKGRCKDFIHSIQFLCFKELAIFKHMSFTPRPGFTLNHQNQLLFFLRDQSECLKSEARCVALVPVTLPSCFDTERGVNHLSAGV